MREFAEFTHIFKYSRRSAPISPSASRAPAARKPQIIAAVMPGEAEASAPESAPASPSEATASRTPRASVFPKPVSGTAAPRAGPFREGRVEPAGPEDDARDDVQRQYPRRGEGGAVYEQLGPRRRARRRL